MASELDPTPAETTVGRTRGPGYGSTDQTHLLDHLRVLSKRRWTALSTFIVTVTAVAAYTWTATPIYEARVRLMIEAERPRVVVFEGAVDQDSDKLDYQQTQVAILQSRGLAKKTLDAMRMWKHPEFDGKPHEDATGIRRWANKVATLVEAGAAALSKSEPPADPAHHADGSAGVAAQTPETAAEAHGIDAFLARLTVTPIRNSRLVDVKFRARDPIVAATAANALADAYVRQNIEYKNLASKEASDWLGTQLEEQRKQVEASQAALQRYREQTASVSTDGRENIVTQKLADLNTAVTRAKTERIQKEALYRQVQGVQSSHAGLDSVPAIVSNTYIQTLKSQLDDLRRQEAQHRQTLGDRHPQMITLRRSIETADARLQTEIAKAVDGLRNDYLAAEAQEQSLLGAVAAQKREVLAMRRKEIDYDALERTATSDRQIFETLLQRTKETGVSSQGVGSNIRIIDAADIPRSPISPRKSRNLFIAMLGGTLLAIGLAFFADYFDKSIQTPDAVKSELGLPCLGLVPMLAADEQSATPLVSNGVPPRFREAFRTLRTNVLFTSTSDAVRTILVTSTGPSEGKTLVATNLAIALAQTRQLVLLIDGDMRRPRIHKIFGEQQMPGLSELTIGGQKPSGVIRETSVPNLWVLTAGAIPPNPAELLSSPAFKKFLTSLNKEFDWVIVDSPPVMAVADASLIANISGGVLFVVAAEQTVTPNALNALEQLDTASAKFLGAVLNRVNLDRNAFFYANYYRHEYSDYYVKS